MKWNWEGRRQDGIVGSPFDATPLWETIGGTNPQRLKRRVSRCRTGVNVASSAGSRGIVLISTLAHVECHVWAKM